MFICEKCGSRYSAMHAATMENCPRCMIRDRTSSPLTFKAFHLPDRDDSELATASAEAHEQERTASA
jgi:DNA-directed RNA polymerase subunit RPC12/RpoP